MVCLPIPPPTSLRDLCDDLAALDDERVLLLHLLENLEGCLLLLWRVVEYSTAILRAAVGALACMSNAKTSAHELESLRRAAASFDA